MKPNWRPWLPENAFADGRAEQALARLVREWADHWFGELPPHLVTGTDPGTFTGRAWRVVDGCLSLELCERAFPRVAAAMLGVGIDASGHRPADERLFGHLASECLSDLCRRLELLVGLPEQTCWRESALPGCGVEARGFLIADADGETLMRLCVARDRLVPLIRSSIPSGGGRTMLPPLADGLGRQAVTLSALLGRCELSLGELAGLVEGDVLMLDRALTAPLDLAIDGRPGFGRAVLDQDGDRLNLTVMDPSVE